MISLCFSTIEIIKSNGMKIVKKNSIAEDIDSLINQINYLLELDEDISDKFPRILEYNYDDKKATYTMPFYDMKHLDRSLINNEISGSELDNLLNEVLNFVVKDLYNKDFIDVPQNYKENKYFNRFFNRINYWKSQNNKVEELLEMPSYKINDKEYLNPLIILEEIKSQNKYDKYILPPKLGLIHGDLEANHILFEINEKKITDFKLIDPRADSKFGDIASDLAKLFQSLYGKSNFIQNGDFILDNSYNNFKMKIKDLNESIEFDLFLSGIKHLDLSKFNDKYLQDRILFNMGMHFLCASPFFLDEKFNNDTDIVLYLRGVQFLNDFRNKVINK